MCKLGPRQEKLAQLPDKNPQKTGKSREESGGQHKVGGQTGLRRPSEDLSSADSPGSESAGKGFLSKGWIEQISPSKDGMIFHPATTDDGDTSIAEIELHDAMTGLMWAAVEGHELDAEELRSSTELNKQDSVGKTALMHAVEQEQVTGDSCVASGALKLVFLVFTAFSFE